jgi:hypothetical protein
VEIGNSSHAIIDLATTVGFEDVDQANMEELFQYHMEKLSNQNILGLERELNDGDESSDVKAFQQSN